MAEEIEKRWIELAQASQIFIEGNATTPIYLTAALEDDMPYVEFIYKDQSLRLHYDFEEGDRVEVDFEKRKVFINGELSMTTIDIERADFFRLEMGENDIMTIPSMTLDVKYNERWY